MKILLASLAPLALAAGLTAGLSAPAHADDRRCTGTIRGASVDGDVVVPRGASCVLVGTRVDGSVKVYGNARLVAKGVRVNGNIQADNHRRVEVRTRLVDDRRVRSVVGGSIQLKQGGGGEIKRVKVNGDIQLFSNDGRFVVRGNTVDGNLQCKSNSPAPVGGGNRVEGNKEDQCKKL